MLTTFLTRGQKGCAWGLVFALLGGGTGTVSAQANVYRCVDAEGKVSYQAQACANAQAGQRMDVKGGTDTSTSRNKTVPPNSRGNSEAWNLPFSPSELAQPAPRAMPAPSASPAPTRGTPNQPPAMPTRASQQRVLEPVSTPQGTAQWGADADVIIVSGYEFSASVTKLHVNHPNAPVLLVLTSNGGTQWKVLPSPGTRIKAIVLASNDRRATVLAPPEVPVLNDELPYAVETANVKFRELISKLNARYGVNKVTGYRGGYRLPELVPVSGPFTPDPNLSLEGLRPEVPRVRISFDLMSTDGRRLPWTNTGPKEGKRYTGIIGGGTLGAVSFAVSENGSEAYKLEGNGGTLVWMPQGLGGPSKKVDLPKELPELSWGSGMAWDSRKGVLAIVSFGGEGYFYRYDTRKQQWLGARSLQNRDLYSLALNAETGGYVSISASAELLIFSERGELEEVRPLADLLPDLGSTYDRGNTRLEGLTVAASGNTVAVVNVRNASVTHIWTYELGTRKAQLTYKMLE
ncbi:DUF4124 domain-containing protein [Paucibacter sp. AS339]|uniref:DUF4124 domain-containing protein n=1 Tax=Paucibacter hankyongi TaxID=3133434 RepID=UPI00309B303F